MKEHMFCPKSGYLLDLNGVQGAAICSVSGYKRDLSGKAAEFRCVCMHRLSPCVPQSCQRMHTQQTHNGGRHAHNEGTHAQALYTHTCIH